VSFYKWTKRGTLLKLPEHLEVIQDSKDPEYQLYALWASGNETLPEYPEDAKELLQTQIDAIEAKTYTSRPVREFVLSGMESAALTKGQTPSQLAASDMAYRKLDDANTQIKALRNLLKVLP